MNFTQAVGILLCTCVISACQTQLNTTLEQSRNTQSCSNVSSVLYSGKTAELSEEYSHNIIESACLPMPDNDKQTLASTMIGPLKDGYFSYYLWRTMIIDNSNNKPIAVYETELQEDADTKIPKANPSSNFISLDTSPYMLTDTDRAVGVKLAIGNDQQCSPYRFNDFLTLFSTKDIKNHKLTPVLDRFALSRSQQMKGFTCPPPVDKTKETVWEHKQLHIEMLPDKTNGLYNMRFTGEAIKISSPSDTVINRRPYTLDFKFNGELYKQPSRFN